MSISPCRLAISGKRLSVISGLNLDHDECHDRQKNTRYTYVLIDRIGTVTESSSLQVLFNCVGAALSSWSPPAGQPDRTPSSPPRLEDAFSLELLGNLFICSSYDPSASRLRWGHLYPSIPRSLNISISIFIPLLTVSLRGRASRMLKSSACQDNLSLFMASNLSLLDICDSSGASASALPQASI